MARTELVRQLVSDREQVTAALQRRRRAVRLRIAAGAHPGVDVGIDRDLRDVAVLAEMARDLRALLADSGWRRPDAAAWLDLPDWLAAELPSERCREVVALRRAGRSWRDIERQSGVRAGNAVAMTAGVVRVARLWPWVLASARGGTGRREIARRFGLPRWGVRAILEHAPPGGDALVAPVGGAAPVERRAPAGPRENGRTPAGGRSRAADRPPVEAGWRVLRTEPGCALRVKAEIERRCEARFGPGWPGRARCVAAVARDGRPGGRGPTATAQAACDGLLAIQTDDAGALDELLRDLPHARGWVGRSVADAGEGGGRARRLPSVVPGAELAAWFRRLGWDGVPEARP